MKNNLTFIIPNYQTSDYLLWCYNSIRKNLSKDYDILIIDDGSKDNSWNIIKELKQNDDNLQIFQNEKNYGISITYNRAIDRVKTDKFVMLHSDMYISPGMDKTISDGLKSYDFFTTFRTEPTDVYPPSNDKIQKNFGKKIDEFDEEGFLNFVKEYNGTGGMIRSCFPWATTKKIFNRINGVNEIFSKYLVDDDDLYLRISLAGFSCYQDHTHPGPYHMTSRTTKFKDDIINHQGTPEWNNQYTRSTRNFIRTWGRGQQEAYNPDMSMNTNIVKRNIGIVVNNCDPNMLYYLEPWCSTIYVDIDSTIYKQKTSLNTMYDMNERVKDINSNKSNNIILELDGKELTQDNFKIITQLQSIIQESGEIGVFELDKFQIKIKDMTPIDKEELIVNTFRNTEGYLD